MILMIKWLPRFPNGRDRYRSAKHNKESQKGCFHAWRRNKWAIFSPFFCNKQKKYLAKTTKSTFIASWRHVCRQKHIGSSLDFLFLLFDLLIFKGAHENAFGLVVSRKKKRRYFSHVLLFIWYTYFQRCSWERLRLSCIKTKVWKKIVSNPYIVIHKFCISLI